MPNIKDLFGNEEQSYKVLSATDITALTSSHDAESFGYIESYETEEERFFPAIDYTKPENFAKYGSAKEYYEASIKRIYRMYPYDGSHKEKIEWHNSSSYLDNYIFDNEYPRANGYLDFHFGTASNVFWGAGLSGTYASSSIPQYITVQGGPHGASVLGVDDEIKSQTPDYKSLSGQSSYTSPIANIYDANTRRASNLAMDGARGNAVECWVNLGTNESGPRRINSVLFDLWNGPNGGFPLSDPTTALGSASYGRFLIEKRCPILSATPLTGNLHVTYMSGTSGVERMPILLTASVGTITASGDWNHVAVSVKNSGLSGGDDGLEIKSYLNGKLIETFLTGTSVGEVTGALNANVGAYRYFPDAVVESVASIWGWNDFNGYCAITGSMDEFRFWKAARNSREIGRNWFTQVYGGTNSDDANTDLGVYYKFNEGITENDSFDQIAIDYSGRISDGAIQNYDSSMRQTGSAMVLAGAAPSEFKDPILYSFEPQVAALIADKELKGYEYDITNNASIINTFPDWILDEDEEVGGGNLQNLVQIIAQYFDNLQIIIEHLNTLKNIEYTKYGEITAIPYADGGSIYNNTAFTVDPPYSASFSGKPLPFSKNLLSAVGMEVPEIFTDASALEALSSRDNIQIFEEKIYDVRNQIYQNIYNNLNYIFKSKGTEKAFRNLIRCYGVDEEIIQLNIYGDNITHKIKDNFRSIAAKKTYIDFNHVDRFSSAVYQMTSSISPYNINTVYSYIPTGSSPNIILSGGYGLTFETEVLFPKKYPRGIDYQPYGFLTVSLYGAHTPIIAPPGTAGQGDTTWNTNQTTDFQVYAIKDVIESNPEYDGDTYFQLTSSWLGINLTSSLFDNVYDNQKWNFAVRIKPTKYPWIGNSVTGAMSSSYEVSFYGVNANLDVISNEFALSASVSNAVGNTWTSAERRLYLGSHRTNFTGALLAQSDVKISSTRAWMDYLSNDEIKAHARDAENHGVLRPYRNAFVFQTGSTPYYIPRSELLILEWDFSQVTSSDSSGEFQFQDISSGSLSGTYAPWITDDRYGGLRDVVRNQFAGKGDLFPTTDTNVAQREYIYSAQQVPPEIIKSSDMVNILERDDLVFTKESLPIDYYIAVEKSMYQTISQEMLKMFATIQDFNHLIGDPVNRYRGQYKNMEKLKSLFYENIENSPDLDKYVEFYKWIDSSITMFLEQLFPASANYAKDMRTLVESHVLERNAYKNKFPTLEMKQEDPETSILGINELTYNWKYGHPPSGAVGVPGPEEQNCLWWNQRAERDGPILSQSAPGINVDRDKILHIATTENSGSYLKRIQGSTYVLRKLSRPYKESVSFGKQFHGGVNFSRTKNRDFYRAKINEVGADNIISFDGDRIFTDPERDCNDNNELKFKQKLKFEMKPSDESDTFKGNLISPFNLYLTNPPATNSIVTVGEIDIVNLHSDIYGASNEVPMQTPFTEKYVGGNQYRHVAVNTSSLTNAQTRPEGFIIDVANNRMYGPEFGDLSKPRATRTREPLAKRPMNIKNILQTTGSTIIGNYDKNYEVVQTSGRKINNKYFVEVEGVGFGYVTGNLLTSPEVPFLSGNYDFQLPDRTVYDSIFTERFSAPGSFDVLSRGYLDPFAEEYSVYNALTFRNWTVRGPRFQKLTGSLPRVGMSASIWSTGSLGLQSLLTRHCAWGGLDFEATTEGAYQKTNRNRLRLIESSSTGYSTGSQYDNWWVQHPIPRSDYQYSWITASILGGNPTDASAGDLILGYFPPDGMVSSSAGGFESAINFCSASELGSFMIGGFRGYGAALADLPLPGTREFIPDDFVGLNTNIYDPVSSSVNTLGYPLGSFAGRNEALFNTDYVYKGGLVRYNTNIYGPGWPLGASGLPGVLNGLLNHRNGPYGWPSWKQIRAGETPVPRHHKKNNIFSISVRNIESLDVFDVFPTLTMQRPLTYKELEGAVHKKNHTRAASIINYTEPMITSKYFPMRHTLDTVNDNILSELVIDHTYTNNLATFANPKLETNIQNGGGSKNIKRLEKAGEQVYDLLVDTYIGGTLPAESNPIKGFKNLVYKETVYPKARNTYLARTRERTNYTEKPSVIQGSSYTQPLGEQRTFWKDSLTDRLRTGGVARNALDYTILSTDVLGPGIGSSSIHDDPRAVGLSIWPLDVGSRQPFVEHPPYYDFIYNNLGNYFKYSVLSGSNHGQLSVNTTTETLAELASGSAIYPNSGIPTASFNYEYQNDIVARMPHNTPASFNAPIGALTGILVPFIPDWQTSDLAGKNPWFDSYEDYAQDIRCFGKNYTVLPEFKISDHIDYYLSQQDFQAKNKNFLSLEGGALSQSAASENSPFDSNFFNEYCHSDFLKHFEVVQKQHQGIQPATQMTIKCHGIKKLLPYNGFYPMTRTVQLGNLFSQSFAPYLTGSNLYTTNPTTERLASIMQPFLNPGILYNTIKSGMAVDWMTFTGSETPAYNTTGAVFIGYESLSGAYRLPFESLADPGAYLPTLKSNEPTTLNNSSLYYLDTSDWSHSDGQGTSTLTNIGAVLQSGSIMTAAFGIWQGNQKLNYIMGMQNFLGESSRFFLENSRYKSIVSGPESQIKPFVSGVTYYMDLVCYKTDDMVMYEGPQHITGGFIGLGSDGELTDVDRCARGIHYGPTMQVTSSTDSNGINQRHGEYRFDPAYAAYTPPYFYGKSVTTFAFKPHLALTAMQDYPPEKHQFTVDEIIGYLKDQGVVHYNQYDLDKSGILEASLNNPSAFERGTAPDTYTLESLSNETQMNNAASFNLFEKMKLPLNVVDSTSDSPLYTDPGSTETYWSISPKFECPVLNFSGTESTAPGFFPSASDGYDYNTRGMWRGYGSIPGDGTGIFFELKESFPESTYAVPEGAQANYYENNPFAIPLSASLLKHLGFNTNLKQRIGAISDRREIFEAIVAIPFREVNNQRVFYPILSAEDPIMKASLSKRVVRAILGKDEPLDPLIYTPGISIIDMVETMQKYVFPPQLDFVTNEDVVPFCMYIFEFGSILDKQDLADIWQGVMPKASLTAEKQTATISHFLNNNELIGTGPITQDLRWMVFKVKQKAEKSYYNVTVSKFDDRKFNAQFDFGGENPSGLNAPKYSYNWPYDFCSLVELAKIDTAVQIGGDIPQVPVDITISVPPPGGAVLTPVQGGPHLPPPGAPIPGPGSPLFTANAPQIPGISGVGLSYMGGLAQGIQQATTTGPIPVGPAQARTTTTTNIAQGGLKGGGKSMGKYGDPAMKGKII